MDSKNLDTSGILQTNKILVRLPTIIIFGLPAIVPVLIHFNGLMHDIQKRVSTVEGFLQINRQEIERISILTKYSIDLVDQQGRSAVNKAVRNKDTKAVIELISAGANVNTKDNRGLSPLHIAAIIQNSEIVRQLISAGANVNTKDNQGLSPLHIATFIESPEIVRQLISAGANVNTKDNQGLSPLHIARSKEQQEVVGELISAGARDDAYLPSFNMTALNQLAEVAKHDRQTGSLN